jgi:hypothetical protein
MKNGWEAIRHCKQTNIACGSEQRTCIYGRNSRD